MPVLAENCVFLLRVYTLVGVEYNNVVYFIMEISFLCLGLCFALVNMA